MRTARGACLLLLRARHVVALFLRRPAEPMRLSAPAAVEPGIRTHRGDVSGGLFAANERRLAPVWPHDLSAALPTMRPVPLAARCGRPFRAQSQPAARAQVKRRRRATRAA